MKTITTITVGETLQGLTNYHKDNRVFHSSFEVLSETKKRFKVRITSEITNCNDWKKPFITVAEEMTISLRRMLEEQYSFCKYNTKTILIKTKN
jgi:hypothetical protein